MTQTTLPAGPLAASAALAPVERARLDKWLWQARFLKSRSSCQKLIAEGRVRLDGQPVEKAHQSVRPGQILTFPLGRHVRVIRVRALGTRRGPATEAQLLYEDLAPPAPETAMPLH